MGKYRMEVNNDILYRVYMQPLADIWLETKQVVVPSKFRKQIMSLAHESIVGGHMGTKKTVDRITACFHWPGVTVDVARFCRSCDICQRTIPRGKVPKVPLGQMPLIDEPFHRVAVDLIGPIDPKSDSDQRICQFRNILPLVAF